MTIYFDMDGTIADFYSVPNWLDCLINEDVTPYLIARPLVNMSHLARLLNKVQRQGIKIGIISWGSKNATNDFDNRIVAAKSKWLIQHMPSVKWDEIHITHYGRDKWEESDQNENSILFDDEEKNRHAWKNEKGYEPSSIFNILSLLTDGAY